MESSLKVLTMRISDLLLSCGVKRSDTVVVYCTLSSKEWDMKSLLAELTDFFAPGTLVMNNYVMKNVFLQEKNITKIGL